MTDWPTWDTDWCKKSFLEGYVEAVRERQAAVGQTLMALPVINDYSINIIKQLQIKLNDLWYRFVNSGANTWVDFSGTSRSTGIPGFTQATWLAAAGLNPGGFRRYTTHPLDGGAVAYGFAQKGDLVDSWLFEDIKAGLQVLRATMAGGNVWSSSSGRRRQASGWHWPSWLAAKAATEGFYSAAGEGSGYLLPCALTAGRYDGAADYTGSILQQKNKQIWTAPSASGSMSRRTDFYAAAAANMNVIWTDPDTGEVVPLPPGEVYHYIYNENGHLGGLAVGLMHLWETILSHTGTSGESSGYLGVDGVLDIPAWCAEPTAADCYGEGFVADYCRAVDWWNVAGGFAYA